MARKSDLTVFRRLPKKDEAPAGMQLFMHEQDGDWTVGHGPRLSSVQLVLGCGSDARLHKAASHASQPWLSVSFGEPHDRTVSCWCKVSDLQEVLTRMDRHIRSTGTKDMLAVIDVEAA
jgi:hypothetical protein